MKTKAKTEIGKVESRNFISVFSVLLSAFS